MYEAPDGCAETYLGYADTLDEARELARSATKGLPEHLYETARAAGHVNGMSAPDKLHEDDEPAEWIGDRCIIAVRG